MKSYDTTKLFSDADMQRRMICAAGTLGIDHAVDSNGCLHYCDADTVGVEDFGSLAIDEAFGNEWIALHIDSDQELAAISDDLKTAGVRFVIEWADDRVYVILDGFLCPAKWSGHQV
jgi:hypothetical protein